MSQSGFEMNEYCCERMRDDRTKECRDRANPYACPDAVIEIAFCPSCGLRLPPIPDLDELSETADHTENGL